MSGQGRGRGGGRGGLVGILGKGIGMAAEYHEHRKERKQLSRETSHQDESPAVASSSNPSQPISSEVYGSDVPPAYGDVSSNKSLEKGALPMDDKQADRARYDAQYDDEDDDEDEDDEDDDLEDDEEDWQLDEALSRKISAQSPPSYAQSEADYHDTERLVQDVMRMSGSGPGNASGAADRTIIRQPLPFPVIIPQRRPRTKARGFVRAYAPALADCGIGQDTFLKFLDNFEKSSQASPVFAVIQVTAGIAGMAPSAIAQAVTTVVQIGAQVGSEMQSRQRTNNFLDRVNEELFKPAGLYAMIIKYKPDADVGQSSSKTDIGKRFGLRAEAVDLSNNQIIAKYGRSISDERSMNEKMRDMRLASGTTQGSIALPEAAPLIFPDVDQAIVANGAEETFKDKAKDAQVCLANYLDRRAQVQYAQQDPNSSLILPEEQRKFKSKLADPNHPMYQGGLLTLVSGGAIGSKRGLRGHRRYEKSLLKGDRRYEKDERKVLRYEQRMDSGRDLSRKKQRRYDRFMDEHDRRMDMRGGYGYGYGIRGEMSRGNFGGRPGLLGGRHDILAERQDMMRSGFRSREYEDSYAHRREYDDHYETYEQDPAQARRSFDDRGLADSYNNSGRLAQTGRYQEQHDPRYANRPTPYGARQRIGRGGGGPISNVRRMMREDVLYLMIVNLPSEVELAQAREELASMKRQ